MLITLNCIVSASTASAGSPTEVSGTSGSVDSSLAGVVRRSLGIQPNCRSAREIESTRPPAVKNTNAEDRRN